MKVLTLDYSTWRSGGLAGAFKTGKGSRTCLLNKEGFKCCLGQWASQLEPKVTDEILLHRGTPAAITQVIAKSIDLITDKSNNNPIYVADNSDFSLNAMNINDDMDTTPEEKIELLTTLCQEHGYILQVINQPAT